MILTNVPAFASRYKANTIGIEIDTLGRFGIDFKGREGIAGIELELCRLTDSTELIRFFGQFHVFWAHFQFI